MLNMQRSQNNYSQFPILRDDSKGGYFTLPPASMGALLIGPGTSITTEALRVLSTRGCLVGVTGGSSSPMYLASTQHRSPHSKLKQIDIIKEEKIKLNACYVLLKERSNFISKYCNLLPFSF